ncbi:MAG: TlyA family RNA methyltransferase [Firmicutes bacterium]|nr:TlyA family RNA methyltransferase [Bacillota bacterium]
MKMRLDLMLVKKGIAESRNKAQSLIMSGIVFVNGQRVDKSGTAIHSDAEIQLRGAPIPYVSRGGLKLAKALEIFPVQVLGKEVLDVGASTGGFTDCLLQNGAKRVVAVDVGYGQLAWRLRQDERVVVMERTNIRHVLPKDLPNPMDLAVIDVSFISLGKVLPAVSNLLIREGQIIALIKPQFEAGRKQIGKRGVVKDADVHVEVIIQLLQSAEKDGMGLLSLTHSPITGPKGNIEFLALWQKGISSVCADYRKLARETVEAAHLMLRGDS